MVVVRSFMFSRWKEPMGGRRKIGRGKDGGRKRGDVTVWYTILTPVFSPLGVNYLLTL